MRCGKAKTLLSDYQDGLLSPESSLELGTHLEECSACKQLLQEMQKTVSLLRTVPVERAPAGFTDAIYARIQQPAVPATLADRMLSLLRVPVFRPVLAAVFTLLIVVAAGVMTFHPAQQDEAYLQEIMADHVSYAAQQPLTDGSGEFVRFELEIPNID